MKITCDVIQDLMPSYIDGILSETVGRWWKNIWEPVRNAEKCWRS